MHNTMPRRAYAVVIVAATTVVTVSACASTDSSASGAPVSSAKSDTSVRSPSGTSAAPAPMTSKPTHSSTAQPSLGSAKRTPDSSSRPHSTTTDKPAPRGPAKKSAPTASSRPSETTPASAPPSKAPKTQQMVLDKLPGNTRAGSCVSVRNKRTVTSGTIAMGNFKAAQELFRAHHDKPGSTTLNFQVIPKHRSMPGAHITLSPAKGPGKTHTSTSHDVEPANIWKYYSVQLPIPKAGTWQIKVQSGSDRGCFIVNFQR